MGVGIHEARNDGPPFNVDLGPIICRWDLGAGPDPLDDAPGYQYGRVLENTEQSPNDGIIADQLPDATKKHRGTAVGGRCSHGGQAKAVGSR